MSNIIRKNEYSVQLPRDWAPTEAENPVRQPGDSYWDAFAGGFKEGFALPFQFAFSFFGLNCGPGSSLENVPMDDGTELPLDTGADAGTPDAVADSDTDAAAEVAPDTTGEGVTDADADAKTDDAGNDAPQDMDAADLSQDAGTETQDSAVDSATDAEIEATMDAGAEVAPEVEQEVAQEIVQEIEPEIVQDVVEGETDAGSGIEADGAPEAALEVGSETVEDDVPQDVVDAMTDAVLPDTPAVDIPQELGGTDAVLPDTPVIDIPEDATNVCQYFCDAGISEADVGLPADATATDVGLPGDVTPTTVFSDLCGPISAPQNSVAMACTNSAINSMLLDATGCVAECGFFDNLLLSSNPQNPVQFAVDMFKPPADPQQTITLSLKGPVLSDGSSPGLPGFLGSSFVFAFDKEAYDVAGDIQWKAQDTDSNGNPKGTVRILFQPYDFIFQKPEFLEVTYEDIIGSKMTYRYPCDTLPSPQVQCTEVK